jgi:hypothetical protein
MAAKTEASSSNIVSTSTPTSGFGASSSRGASMPFSSGICRSITTTSGSSAAAADTASLPFVTSARTSRPAAEPSSVTSPLRKTG